jgi:PAS domain-containing protein
MAHPFSPNETRLSTAGGGYLTLPAGVPAAVLEYLNGRGGLAMPPPHAASGGYTLDLPLSDLHRPQQTPSGSSDDSSSSPAADASSDAESPPVAPGAPVPGRAGKRRAAQVVSRPSAGSSDGRADDAAAPAAAGKRARRNGRTATPTASSAGSPTTDDLSLAVCGGAAHPEKRKVRHKQTEDVRRHRINNAIEALRSLLNLEARAGKADILELARKTIVEKTSKPQPALDLPCVPRVAIILASCTTHTIVDLNTEALRTLGLSRKELPISEMHTKLHNEEDKPFIMPGIAPVVCGLKQSVTVCKRFRTQGEGQKLIWGRFTLTRSLHNNEVYITAVGSFLDEPPSTGLPYYIF